MKLAGWLLLIAMTGAALVGCRGEGAARCGDTDATPVDTEVMAFLSAARALHHEANVKEDSADLPGAIAALDRLVALPTPHPGSTVPEVEEVMADAYARRAELRLRARDLDGAGQDVNAGLARAKEPTYFRGHLLEVRGLVDEARASTLVDAGKSEEAARAKARAIESFEEAVSVQSKVIERTLGGDAGGTVGK
jgi:hypothetical protein